MKTTRIILAITAAFVLNGCLAITAQTPFGPLTAGVTKDGATITTPPVAVDGKTITLPLPRK